MADYDYEHGKIFGVVERLGVGECKTLTQIESDILERTPSFIEKLIKGKGFQAITYVSWTECITFLPTKKLAEEFQDEIVKEKAMRSALAVH